MADLEQRRELREGSVQKFREGELGSPTVFFVASAADECPNWWSPARDTYLRRFWPTEPYLAGSIYSIVARNAAFPWEIKGPDRVVRRTQEMLAQADFEDGWVGFIEKTTTDLLTGDNGTMIEVIRPATVMQDGKQYPAFQKPDAQGNKVWWAEKADGTQFVLSGNYQVQDNPNEPAAAIAHLDSSRCQRTGDPDIPVLYTDLRGGLHRLAWWQVIQWAEMPSPLESANGVGFSAVSRALKAAQILRDVQIYQQEKVSGRFAKAVHLTNIPGNQIEDAIRQAQEYASSNGLLRYMLPIIAHTMSPDSTPSVATIQLAAMPDGWNEAEMLQWYIALLAMVLGVDYGFLAPLPGKGLGTASQSETQERQSRGKSSRLFMKTLEYKFNYSGVLPNSVEFHFTEMDTAEALQQAQLRMVRAQERALRVQSGEITAQVAQQIAVDDGDLAQEYLSLMGQQDVTPTTTVQDTEDAEAQQISQAAIEANQAKPAAPPATGTPPAPEQPGPVPAAPIPETKAMKRRRWWQGVGNLVGGRKIAPVTPSEEQTAPTGKVQPTGQPLRPWGTDPVPVDDELIQTVLKRIRRQLPDEVEALLGATVDEQKAYADTTGAKSPPEGHPFYGNQWTEGAGGGGGDVSQVNYRDESGRLDFGTSYAMSANNPEQRAVIQKEVSATYNNMFSAANQAIKNQGLTGSISRWQSEGGYQEMNLLARQGKGALRTQLRNEGGVSYTEDLNNEMDRVITLNEELDEAISFGAINEDVILYRGIRADSLDSFTNKPVTIGSVFRDKGFVATAPFISTSLGASYAGGCIMEIRVPKGTPAAWIGGSESELLLGRGTKFKIVDIRNETRETIGDNSSYSKTEPLRRYVVEVIGG